MGSALQHRIDIWKKQLLDLGKRNRLVNFKEGKRNNVKITSPSIEEMYNLIVGGERSLQFPYAKRVEIDENGEESYDAIIEGDIETSRAIGDLQKTLRALRLKAKTSIEEQGINILYLTFGSIKWKENDSSEIYITSPLVLVPVSLSIESATSPFVLSIHDDEIVVNPSLIYKFESDFGINIPDFDNSNDDIVNYLKEVESLISNKGWQITSDMHLTILSFLKINMYKDLDKHEEKLNSNSVVSAIAGESDAISIPSEFNDYDHDSNTKPIDTYQVVDADSSQQDAVLLSKSGTSFVLQGPPGTGKSQTITNIISEALADGKKVLFVSEKMAALQVVYNRLSDVGLSDFCFALHSHKAKKKDILRDLANSTHIDRKRVREEILGQLDNLDRKRSALNVYQQELHTPCSALNYSIFEVNGRLAKLSIVPDIIFPINNVETTKLTELNERCYILKELSTTIGKRSEDYSNNVWRNANVEYLSNELRHDIDSKFAVLLPTLENLDSCFKESVEKLRIEIKPVYNNLDNLIELLSFAGESPLIPTKWILEDNINILSQKALDYKDKCQKIIYLKKMLSLLYQDELFNLTAVDVQSNITTIVSDITKEITIDENSDLLTELLSKANEIDNSLKQFIPLLNKTKKIANTVDLDLNSLYQVEQVCSAVEISRCGIRPTAKWFEIDINLESEVSMYREQHEETARLREEILSNFDKEVLDIDFFSILKRFRVEYSTIFRIFSSSYKRDIRTLTGYISGSLKLNYKTALEWLTKIKTYSDKLSDIQAKQDVFTELFGNYYQGIDTLWDKIIVDISHFKDLVNLYNGEVPVALKTHLLNETLPLHELKEYNDCYSTQYATQIINSVNKLGLNSIYNEANCNDVTTILKSIALSIAELQQQYSSVNCNRVHYGSFSEVLNDIDKFAEYQQLSNSIESMKDKVVSAYLDYYNGINTNWDNVIDALSFAQKFKQYIEENDLPRSIINSVCSDSEFIIYCKNQALQLAKFKNESKANLDWIFNLFESSELLKDIHIADLIDRLSKCKDKKYLLEEWVDYKSNIRKCQEMGLSEFILQIEQTDIEADNIVNAYMKRFYRLWLDVILPQFPAVQTFRSHSQEQTIADFKVLDKSQFAIAQKRVRERVVSRIPDFNAITSTRDEIGILKRELNKQRKIMPMRKLFKAIPNLITALRPCFMMSPLSVSLFLEADSYEFDMVIFDEASQVHTEDAIGAIMRGKQVIIVGDTKQLPPTNFFATTVSDEGYDTDEENEDGDAGAYQSILDESVAVLPERSLRWHYRSRHEDLITFSNVKIYGNSLITFPSSIEKTKDFGVEYIHVADGVYDRGKKRSNMPEAKRVATLVVDHFHKYPTRSLGVVTFSEAQMQAVDGAIRHLRQSKPSYDRFFAEDRNEPFFIKNIENVQGDERDTIIFSIGYARDVNGTISMNFGALNKEGGHRRLNVAITRAKHNVKLVGSIVPTDIDLDRTAAEGVKLLRSYIEFAQLGVAALQKESTYSEVLDFDSPFEEAVYDFLVSNDYNVTTQVGCSGFRIDMAIKHPTKSGLFAIGIECDGATYHSSRTARERDRLRQEVLEGMGWTIHRIWSTDWIKDQKSEEQKLLIAIEKAMGNIPEDNLFGDEKDLDTISIIETMEIEEDIVTTEIVTNSGYGFTQYIQANIYEYQNIDGREIIRDVIKIEQPIHVEELCRRTAPLFGNQKATSKVRNTMEYLFKNYFKEDIVRSGDFVTLQEFDDLKVRIPNSEENYIRNITYISPNELSLAMIIIVNCSFGITPEDLFIVTAREFGFKRTSENISTTLRRVYEQMLCDGEVREVDGKVSVIRNCQGL